MRRQKVEVLIGERLSAKEAAKRGLSLQALLDIEVTSKVGLVAEQEIETYHKANKARLQGEGDEVAVRLTAPPIARIEVPIDGAIAMGPATAPVTIVEFTDFHCPFCNRVQPTLGELKFRFGEKLRHVHRDFPLDRLHP